MGLKCPKCGEDNLFTAVFCVKCGERMDLEGVSIETLTKKPFEWRKFLGKFFSRAFATLLTLIVVGIILVFVPVHGKLKADKPSPGAKTRFRQVRGIGGHQADAHLCTFTGQDATNLLNNSVKAKFKTKGKVVPTALSIRFLDDNRVRVVVTSKYFSFIKIDSVLTYRPEMVKVIVVSDEPADGKGESSNGEEKRVEHEYVMLRFKPLSASMGYCPMPFILKRYPLRQASLLLGTLSSMHQLKRFAKGAVAYGEETASQNTLEELGVEKILKESMEKVKKAGGQGGEAAAETGKAATGETPKGKEAVSSGNESQNAEADESTDEAAEAEKTPAATADAEKPAVSKEAAAKNADKKPDSAAPQELKKSQKAVGGKIVFGI